MYKIFFLLICFIVILCSPKKTVVPSFNDSVIPDTFVIKDSQIPGAGKGLYTTKDIPKDTYLGYYTGDQIDRTTYNMLRNYNAAQYLFSVPECANQKEAPYINGDASHEFSKMNYAPEFINKQATSLQAVEFRAFCEKPYVRVYSIRDIKTGEEIYVSYGKNYNYSFMKNKEIQEFFLRKTNIKLGQNEEFTFSE